MQDEMTHAEAVAKLAELAEENEQLSGTVLRLIDTAKYLVGIAARGEQRRLRDDETAESFVLGYVRRLEADARRLDWVEKLFDRKWNGVVGGGSAYHYDLIGPWRHAVHGLTGESLREAIDAAMLKTNAPLERPVARKGD